MNDDSMRESLLRQHTSTTVAVQMLYDLLDAENRRVRRLTHWTWVVWLLWFVLTALYVLLAVNTYMRPEPPSVSVFVVTWPFFLVLVPLAVIGGVLLVELMLARRSATVSQLRVSIAAIDAQLKQLQHAATAQPAQPADQSGRQPDR